MNKTILIQQISKVRTLLHSKFTEKNSLLDPEVYQLSCELDNLIVAQQRLAC